VHEHLFVIDHPSSSVVYNFGRFRPSVLMSVCQKITFESRSIGSSFSYIQYISRKYAEVFIRGRGHAFNQKLSLLLLLLEYIVHKFKQA